MITYCREKLISLNKNLQCLDHSMKDNIEQFSDLIVNTKENICTLFKVIKPQIRVTNKPRPTRKNRGVNHNNLRSIDIINDEKAGNVLNSFNLCVLNCQSIRNKTDELQEYLLDNDLDIFVAVETWLKPNDTVTLHKLLPSNYSAVTENRIGRRGGGLAVIHKSVLETSKNQSIGPFTSFELLDVHLKCSNEVLRIVCLYRPPSSSLDVFLSEFTDLLYETFHSTSRLLLVGDLNLHLDDAKCSISNKFYDILNSFNLRQHTTGSTHRKGHLLDVVITRVLDDTVEDVNICDDLVSDHFSIFTKLKINKPVPKQQTIAYRKIRNINIEDFRSDIINSEISEKLDRASIDQQIIVYNDTLRNILDDHAPIKKAKFTIRPNRKWFTDEIRQSKIHRRSMERLWRNSNLEINKQLYTQARNSTNNLIRRVKKDYILEQINVNKDNPKVVQNIVNSILKPHNQQMLPDHSQDVDLAEEFSRYFTDKIDNIRTELETDNNSETTCLSVISPPSQVLSEFSPTSNKEIKQLVAKSSSSTCELDPLPSPLLKLCIDELCPVLTHIVNTSLSSGTFPDALKEALVFPLIKKSTLDNNVFKNYRPVSNLSFLSKLVEKVVSVRFKDHLKFQHLDEPFQSAYKKLHSTETALLRVHNDVLIKLDSKNVVFLVLLDLSAAFDTIDQPLLLKRLQNYFGITGYALKWFESYLTSRKQSVVINKQSSKPVYIKYGVPQGSVLGPLLFTAYTCPLGKLLRDHNLDYHIYADDTQLYVALTPDDESKQIIKLEKCIDNVKNWMKNNFLKLNDDKTELLKIGTDHRLSTISTNCVKVGGAVIHPSNSVRNLGVKFDKNFDMKEHVSNMCKSANFQLYNIGRIRNFIDTDTSKLLVNSLVTSRLDYCNSLLFNLPSLQLNRLQKIQNKAARIITRTKLCEHITPILHQLHWLPVTSRIEFKILSLTYSIINIEDSPGYLKHLVTPYIPTRTLRSQNKNLLMPYHAKSSFGERSFSFAAFKLWNKLPSEVKDSPSLSVFKKKLKTHLFKTYFN
ncbi:hypothetical protein SNE40_002773 [Patella caerulea]|uniref:Reverse transcriptase domain-containing protein n=1 Tax=Patella caerulea TaxID=87958 RepID=A0AAN8K9D5_PATCE